MVNDNSETSVYISKTLFGLLKLKVQDFEDIEGVPENIHTR